MTYSDELRESFSNSREDTEKDNGIDYANASAETFQPDSIAPTKEPLQCIKRNNINGGMVVSALSSAKDAGTPTKKWW